MAEEAPPTSRTLELRAEALTQIEPLLAPWGPRCGLLPGDLARLAFAVSELCEAAITLAQGLGFEGRLDVSVEPFSRWLTVRVSFPKAIPLDPVFDPDDPCLVELPGLRLAPDIFWRRIVVEWVDRATWTGGPFSTSVALTQYARDAERPSELYFLGLTPRPVPGVTLRPGADGVVLALRDGSREAFRLPERMAFVLDAADGRAPVRDLYAAYVARFGLVRPQEVGRIVEQLVERGLLETGERLAAEEVGPLARAGRLLRRAFTAQVSFRDPDRLVEVIGRRAGWLLSPGGVAGLAVGVAATWAFLLAASRPFAPLELRLLLARPAALGAAWLAAGAAILSHELAHALALKRFGGTVHAMGVMIYFGIPCPFVDTSDAWTFGRASRKVLTSLAGPFSDVVWASALAGASVLLHRTGHPAASVAAGAAGRWLLLVSLLNLLPLLDTDGYHALADGLGVTNLRRRATAALAGLAAPLRGAAPPPRDPRHGIVLAYGLGAAAVAAGVLAWALACVAGPAPGGGPPRNLLVLVLVFAVQLASETGTAWYRRAVLAPIDLKRRTRPALR